MNQKTIYRVTFFNQDRLYEVYARSVSESTIFGFIMLEELVFGETSAIVVDPGQERLKNEFAGVKSTFIPMHNILRIDEVEKEGVSKITTTGKDSNVSQFPGPIYAKPTETIN
jgi:hypothetical protein